MKVITIYEAFDGTQFDDKSKCEQYEAKQNALMNAALTEFAQAVLKIKGDRSIRQMAADTNISASYITAMIHGKYYPTIKILKRLTNPNGHPHGNITVLDLLTILP